MVSEKKSCGNENCVDYLNEHDHICEFNSDQLTEDMKKFGIIKKYIQPNPENDDEERKYPFWATSHNYGEHEEWGMYSTPVFEFEQAGLKHWFGTIELGMADAICKVPALPASMDSLGICQRIMTNDNPHEYQRPLDFGRIDNIRNFLSDQPTIVNPIILDYSQSSLHDKSVKIRPTQNGLELTIDLQKIDYILKNRTDVAKKNPRGDYRPLELVDGQHRVRSSGTNVKALGLTIPFVLINPEYNGGGGRIFSEINVQQESLKPLFNLHNRYMKSLSSHKDEEDFGEVSASFFDETQESGQQDKIRFANRTAYRVGAILNFNKNGPLHNLIKYHDENEVGWKEGIKQPPRPKIGADEWVKICREWVSQRIELAKDEEEFIEVIEAYFSAWKKTANTNPETGKFYQDYNSDKNRWGWGRISQEDSWKQSRLFNKVVLKPIMALFPMCYDLVRKDTDIDLEEAFFQILSPCQAIDGCDFDSWKWIMDLGKTKEIEKYLFQWMSWAIKDYSINGELVEPNEAWNHKDLDSSTLSGPGKGFFSGINSSYFSGTLKIENLSSNSDDGLQGSTITVTADVIPNESEPKVIKLEYRDRDGVIRFERKKHTKGNTRQIGFQYYQQRFLTATTEKGNGLQSLIITITSKNLLMDAPGEIFKQEYTINELKNIGEKGVIISTKETKMNFEDLNFSFEKIVLQNVDENKSEVYHYGIQIDEDASKGTKSIEDVDEKKKDIEFEKKKFENLSLAKSRIPPPSNKRLHAEGMIKNRVRYQPKPYCNHCFHGNHDQASCGVTNMFR